MNDQQRKKCLDNHHYIDNHYQGRTEGKLVGGGKSQNSKQIEFLARFSQQNAEIPNESTFRRQFSQQILIFQL